MAYDISNLGGLSALSPTVSAYQKFVEQKDRVNDNNVVPFLLSRGEPQLAGLIAKKLRLEQANNTQQKLMQQPPSAPPTVAQQYDMAAQNMGLAGMSNPVMERAQFAGGGIVAFAGGGTPMQLPKSEVFSDAGLEEYIRRNFPNWDQLPENEKREVARAYKDQYLAAQSRAMQREALDPRSRRDYAPPAPPAPAGLPAALPAAPTPPPPAAPMAMAAPAPVAPPSAAPVVPSTPVQRATPSAPRPQAPAPAPAPASSVAMPDMAKPQTLEEISAARIARDKAAGITGDATKAYEDFLKARTAEIPEEKKAAYKNAWMVAGARMLGSRSPFFAQALGEAAEAGITGYQKDLKEIKAAEQALRQADTQLRMNKEAAARGDLRADEAELRRQQDNYTNKQFKLYELQSAAREKALDRATQLQIAKLNKVTGGEARIGRLQTLFDATQEEGLSPQERAKREDALVKQLDMDRKFTAATTSGGYAADIRSDTATSQLLQKIRESQPYQRQQLIADNPNRPESERNAARIQMAKLERDALQGGPRVTLAPDYVPESGNISNPYAGFSATPLP